VERRRASVPEHRSHAHANGPGDPLAWCAF
jgi:hypothetical protein